MEQCGKKRLLSKYFIHRVTEIHEGTREPAVPKVILLLTNRGHKVEAPSSGL